jgi:hypothetical protein
VLSVNSALLLLFSIMWKNVLFTASLISECEKLVGDGMEMYKAGSRQVGEYVAKWRGTAGCEIVKKVD